MCNERRSSSPFGLIEWNSTAEPYGAVRVVVGVRELSEGSEENDAVVVG